MAMTTSVSLVDLRKEQRRLAALLNKPGNAQHIPKAKKYPTKEMPPFWAWCSHLDPKGNFRNPALDFLRQGLENVGKQPPPPGLSGRKHRLVLSARREKDGPPANAAPGDTDSVYSYGMEALATARRAPRPSSDSPSKLRYTTKHGDKGVPPPGYRGRALGAETVAGSKDINRRDIEDFSYSNLKRPVSLEEDDVDEEVRQLGLDKLRGAREKKAPHRAGIPFFVPENTPAPSTAAARSSIGLPAINQRGGMVGTGPGRNMLVPDNTFIGADGSPEAVAKKSHGVASSSLVDASHAISTGDKLPPIHKGALVSSLNHHSSKDADGRSGGCQCHSPLLSRAKSFEVQREKSCLVCGGKGSHRLNCAKNESMSGSNLMRCSKCGLERTASGEVSGSGIRENSKLPVTGARQNTMASIRESTLGGSYQRQRTDLSSPPFMRVRSASARSEESVIMEEIEDRLQELGADMSVTWDPHNHRQEFDAGDPPTLVSQLTRVDDLLEGGALDFHTDLDVNNVDTTLKIAITPEPAEEAGLLPETARKPRRKRAVRDGNKEAYEKALSVAAAGRLPQEPWMFGTRVTSAYKFSYFDYLPKPAEICVECTKNTKGGKPEQNGKKAKKQNQGGKKPASPPRMPKNKLNEMKHIFGNLDVNDYYPGGRNNPLE